MGTFTKSFGAAGGYIGGSTALINHLRQLSHGSTYASTISPPVAAQALTALKTIGYTQTGKNRINQLAKNTRVMRQALKEAGFLIFGCDESPVIPVIICEFCKMEEFQKMCAKYGLAVVVVSFPATPLSESRARLCLSGKLNMEEFLV